MRSYESATVLYGLLHDDEGELVVKTPKRLKVSIGLPRGRDAHAFLGPDGAFVVACGPKQLRTKDLGEAKAAYARALAAAPERRAPLKLPYFTFTRTAADGSQVADLDCIAAMGPMPTKIDVVMFGRMEDCYRAQFENWGRTELQCYGNGRTAQRLIKLATTPEDRETAKKFESAGDRYFPVVGRCYESGECPFTGGDNPACKPHTSLTFQLHNYPLVGASAGYTTTSLKTVKVIGAQMASLFKQFGSLDGMVITLECLPYLVRGKKAWYVGMDGSPVRYTVAVPAPTPEPVDQTLAAKTNNEEFQPTEGPAADTAPPDEDYTEPPEVGEDGDSEPEPEPEPAPDPVLARTMRYEDLTPDQVRQLRQVRKMNKAQIETFLGGFAQGTPYSAVLEGIKGAKD